MPEKDNSLATNNFDFLVKNFTKEQVKAKMLAVSEKEMESAKQLTRAKAKERKIQTLIGNIRGQIASGERSRLQIERVILVMNDLPEEIVNLREEIKNKTVAVQRGNITMDDFRKLSTEIGEDEKTLQLKCNHEFIVNWPGYEGSYSYDYDNAYYGFRFCLICGLYDSSSSTKKEDYKKMPDSAGRLVIGSYRWPGVPKKTGDIKIWELSIRDIQEVFFESGVLKFLV